MMPARTQSGQGRGLRGIRRAAPWLAIVLGAGGFTYGGGAGCIPFYGGGGGGPTEPLPLTALSPRYVLESVNNLPLPATLRQAAGRTESVVADTLLFALASPTAKSGEFTEITVIETREGTAAPVTTRQQSAPGTRTFTRTEGAAIGIAAFVGGSAQGGSAFPAAGQQPATLFLYEASGRSWRYAAR